jgi:FkbM family methyltransferase
MVSLLRSLGWSPRSVLDIGGYKGHWTRQVRAMFPSASFVVVEPNPHPELKTLGVPVHAEVLSATPETIPWYSNLSTGDSIYKELTSHYASVAPTMRTTTTLDVLFPDTQFDFIKLDCQGAEVDILKGGESLVGRADVLLLECAFAARYNQGAPTFAEYIAYLDSIGFAPLDITELHRANGILCQIDLVCLRKTSPLWARIQDIMTR